MHKITRLFLAISLISIVLPADTTSISQIPLLGVPLLLAARAAIEAPEVAQVVPFINGSIGQTKIGHQQNGGPALANGDAFGAGLSATDINKDGRIDLLIGAPGDHDSGWRDIRKNMWSLASFKYNRTS